MYYTRKYTGRAPPSTTNNTNTWTIKSNIHARTHQNQMRGTKNKNRLNVSHRDSKIFILSPYTHVQTNIYKYVCIPRPHYTFTNAKQITKPKKDRTENDRKCHKNTKNKHKSKWKLNKKDLRPFLLLLLLARVKRATPTQYFTTDSNTMCVYKSAQVFQ